MRPTLSELIRGLKHEFDAVIVPDLHSPYPRHVAEAMSALLEHLLRRYELGPEIIEYDNEQLAGLLARCESILAGVSVPRSAAVVDMIRETLRSEAPAGRHCCLDRLVERNESLRWALVDVLSLPSPVVGRQMTADITDHLAKQLEREDELVNMLQVHS